MTKHSQDAAHRHRPASCWFCSHRLTVAEIERDGIIRSRRQNLGGPYRLLACPQCGRENLCERSRRGRWFASPNMRVSVLEYFFSQLLDTRPEDFLAAASWLRENEARRRYFFERDGDSRYSGGWLSRFWPFPPEGDEPAARRERPREPGATSPGAAGGRPGATTGADERAGQSEQRKRRPRAEAPCGPGRLLSPYEILGIPATSDAEEIRSAFRRLARQFHPDKVYHLGEEAQRLAHEKFTRLKAAYETLLARREGGGFG